MAYSNKVIDHYGERRGHHRRRQIQNLRLRFGHRIVVAGNRAAKR